MKPRLFLAQGCSSIALPVDFNQALISVKPKLAHFLHKQNGKVGAYVWTQRLGLQNIWPSCCCLWMINWSDPNTALSLKRDQKATWKIDRSEPLSSLKRMDTYSGNRFAFPTCKVWANAILWGLRHESLIVNFNMVDAFHPPSTPPPQRQPLFFVWLILHILVSPNHKPWTVFKFRMQILENSEILVSAAYRIFA